MEGASLLQCSAVVDQPKISDTDKVTVRENLMEAIVHAPPIIR
jgi:hypothetical protein